VELASRVALVTGAGRRIGRAIALALAGRGARIAIHYHSSEGEAEETERQVRALGAQAVRLQADLSDPVQARDLPGRAAAEFGRLDVVVNCAANMIRASVEETTPELWDRVMNTNLRACFFVVQGALPWLRAQRGKVINMADLGGLEPWPRYIAHSISKAGVVMLTRTLARALAPDVTVNAIAPGAVLPPDDWDQAARDHLVRTTPLQRLGSPTDVTSAVLYLLEAGDYVTGDTLVVDGGRLVR
jgi:pteridine reductase